MPTNRRTPSTSMPQRRTQQEARRLRAAELFAQGRSQAEVAQELGVSRQSAKRWQDRWQQGGAQALRSRGRTGRPPNVPDDQLAQIEQALLQARGRTGSTLTGGPWAGWLGSSSA